MDGNRPERSPGPGDHGSDHRPGALPDPTDLEPAIVAEELTERQQALLAAMAAGASWPAALEAVASVAMSRDDQGTRAVPDRTNPRDGVDFRVRERYWRGAPWHQSFCLRSGCTYMSGRWASREGARLALLAHWTAVHVDQG